ncbi:DUF438 domain-containing protein [Olsenella sp. Marseille-P4559]|uniref:DUF438 domain-containing protein n=1 Tax=Olsenella sp. Marseille-P4559 TaxID=2364795 RepID=UPI00102FD368|nr:DUF438 domain-containing protein [Olsenella sp. Marseille-P4559]
MATDLDLSKSVHDLAQENPGFTDVMAGLGFTDIAKPAALNTVGRVMTVPKGCAIKGISLEDAVRAFEEAGFTVSGVAPVPASAAASVPATAPASEAAAPAPRGQKVEGLDEEGRAKLLQSYVARLSAGEALESVRADFVANFEGVDAGEIARAEQGLIQGGVKIDDVQRLCDVHSALFHGATREERIANAEDAVMGSLAKGANDFTTRVLSRTPGHPVRVFTLENQAISAQIEHTRAALAGTGAADELRTLSKLGIHYAKKGDLIYPALKVRHGYSGPSDVMWGVDDEIRAELRALLDASDHDAGWHERVEKVLTRAEEMVYKETNILLPLCAQNFTNDEWLQMYADMRGYDLCLIDDAGTWGIGEDFIQRRAASFGAAPAVSTPGEIHLPTGHFTSEQLDAMLNTIPLEITFIDGQDVNRYWNDDGEKKLFKRPSSALDREVWSCHPPKVQPMVRRVISSLKSGEQDSVDIWMQKEGEPVLVRYMAVRDRMGAYLGTMEVVQRMGFAEKHFA